MVDFNPAITAKLNGLSSNLLNGHHIFSKGYDDNYLAKRYSRAEKHAHNISYGISGNSKHIQQYYNIRQNAYREVIQKYQKRGAPLPMGADTGFYAGEDDHDRRSVLYLALAGDNCIGGVRLTISTPDASNKLTMEDESFSLQDNFPSIDLSRVKYCEASKVAILPDYLDGEVWDVLQRKSTEYVIEEGVEIVFCQSHKLSTKRFKQQFSRLGFEVIVRKDIKTKATEEFKALGMQFWAVDFTPEQKYALRLTGANIPANVELQDA